MSHLSVKTLLSGSYLNDIESGPVAIIFAEDTQDVVETVDHHVALGFVSVIVIGTHLVNMPPHLESRTICVDHSIQNRDQAVDTLNTLIPVLAGRWVLYLFNTEYLFFPYSESRRIHGFTTFMEEERRESVFTYVIDLYPSDLWAYPNGVSRETAHFDRSGFYGFQRYSDGQPLDRQFDIYGGLGWRFEQFIPWERRRIDRISLFKANANLKIRNDLTLSEPEMNTISCKWHHNATCALASFRVAKSLKRNPGSTYEIDSFTWSQSEPFNWRAAQLMELGFIEPGQWF